MKEIDLKNIDPSLLNQLEIVAAQDQISRDLGGEAVILNTKTGVYCGLNEVGARIWQLIQEPSKVDDLIRTVTSEYDVEPDRFQHDLLNLLQKMLVSELIPAIQNLRPQAVRKGGYSHHHHPGINPS